MIYLLFFVILVAIGIATYFLVKRFDTMLKARDEREESAFVSEIRSQIDQKLTENSDKVTEATRQVNERLSEAAKHIMEVNRTNLELTKSMGQFHEIGKSMKEFQDLFISQKSRGVVGEQVLAEILKLVLPDKLYELQYRFADGTRVDAVVKMEAGLIPVDSKFPYENFQLMMRSQTEAERNAARREFIKDVKNHIDGISKKYILPAEGTVEWAVMYVPMETIYNTISEDAALVSYAQSKKIWSASPNNFYQLLTIILQMHQHVRANESVEKALKAIRGVQQESDKFGVELSKLTTHINHTKNMSDTVNNRFQRLTSKIENATVLEIEGAKVVEEQSEKILPVGLELGEESLVEEPETE